MLLKMMLVVAVCLAGAVLRAKEPVVETAKWQDRINAASRHGGGVVVVPAGRHVVGQLNLRSNVELHLEEGAVLEGVFGIQNYGILSLPCSEGTWSAVVMAVGATNIAVTGKGVIDGKGSLWPQATLEIRNQEGLRPRGMLFADCQDVRLEDFTLRDAACWGIVFKRCVSVVARRVKIDNHANANNDGFDIEGRDVLIEDCDVDSGDDAYCFKANDPDFKGGNIVVRNCVGRSHSNCYKLGTGTHGTIRGLFIENCTATLPRRDFMRTCGPKAGRKFFWREHYSDAYPEGVGKTALAIQNCDGGDISDVVVDGFSFEGYVIPFCIRGARRLIRPPRIPPNDLLKFHDITFRNVRGKAISPYPAWICGIDGLRIKGVTLENVEVEMLGCGSETRSVRGQGTEFDNEAPMAEMFCDRTLPAYGLYIDKADDVRLANVRFPLAKGRADFRPSVFDSGSPRGIDGLIEPEPERNLRLNDKWARRFRTFESTADGSRQPFYWYDPGCREATPLVVVFHSWGASCNWSSPVTAVQEHCARHGWALVYPNCRGPNVRPEACGSELVCQDVLDVIEWAQKERRIDASRIYAIGGSGGGHLSLLVAGRFPELFAGVASFCPITDLTRWQHDSTERKNHYVDNLVAVCGGLPDKCENEYASRSPLTYLSNARANGLPVYIVTGIHDGHSGSVPVGHAIRAFNVLADVPDRLSETDIAELETSEAVPARLTFSGRDPFYSAAEKILLRRTSAQVRLTVFDAGHAGNMAAGLDFLGRQQKGCPADFTLPYAIEATAAEQITK